MLCIFNVEKILGTSPPKKFKDSALQLSIGNATVGPDFSGLGLPKPQKYVK